MNDTNPKPRHERDVLPYTSHTYQVRSTSRVMSLYVNRYFRRRRVAALKTQIDVLAVVKLFSDTNAPIRILAERLHVMASTLSRSISRLVARGLLTKIPFRGDRRQRLVRLTPAGEELLDLASRAVEKALHPRISFRIRPHAENLRKLTREIIDGIRRQMSCEVCQPETPYHHDIWCGVPEAVAWKKWQDAHCRPDRFTF